MYGGSPIDTRFDVRTDASGHDPDSHSATLRRYHQLLWSKPLPNGSPFELDTNLHHQSELGGFLLSSDRIAHTYTAWAKPARLVGVIGQISSNEKAAFNDLACTVGAYTVFPRQLRNDEQWRLSINQARGLHSQIKDRFDLTLECIRRHYLGQESPLRNTLSYFASFFGLFVDFAGYVDHFLLNDLVTAEYTSVRFYTEFDDFASNPLPTGSVGEYREYMRRSIDFICARNARIDQYALSLGAQT